MPEELASLGRSISCTFLLKGSNFCQDFHLGLHCWTWTTRQRSLGQLPLPGPPGAFPGHRTQGSGLRGHEHLSAQCWEGSAGSENAWGLFGQSCAGSSAGAQKPPQEQAYSPLSVRPGSVGALWAGSQLRGAITWPHVLPAYPKKCPMENLYT